MLNCCSSWWCVRIWGWVLWLDFWSKRNSDDVITIVASKVSNASGCHHDVWRLRSRVYRILFSLADSLNAVVGTEWLCISFLIIVWSCGLEFICSLQCDIITSWNTEQFYRFWLEFSFMAGYTWLHRIGSRFYAPIITIFLYLFIFHFDSIVLPLTGQLRKRLQRKGRVVEEIIPCCHRIINLSIEPHGALKPIFNKNSHRRGSSHHR